MPLEMPSIPHQKPPLQASLALKSKSSLSWIFLLVPELQMFPWQEPQERHEQSLNKKDTPPTQLWSISLITQTRLTQSHSLPLSLHSCGFCAFINIPWALKYITHTH